MTIKKLDGIFVDTSNDFIYNLFNITHPTQETFTYNISVEQNSYLVPALFQERTVYLGVWLYHIPIDSLQDLCKYIFKHEKVDRICFKNMLLPCYRSRLTYFFEICIPRYINRLINLLKKIDVIKIRRLIPKK